MINGGIILHSYFRSFRGYLRIRIKGYGATRFINICSKRGIKLWDMEKDDEGYELCITVPDFWKIPDIVRKTGVRAAIVSKHGLPFFFAKRYALTHNTHPKKHPQSKEKSSKVKLFIVVYP